MPGIRSRRLKLLEGMRRALNDLLHERAAKASESGEGIAKGASHTTAIHGWAEKYAPEMLDQLFKVHIEADRERSGQHTRSTAKIPANQIERRKMLSAVRARVAQTVTGAGAR